MTEITAEELLIRYEAGERSFPNIILSDVCLIWDGVNTLGEDYGVNEAGGVELTGVDFSGAIFQNIRIEHSFQITNVTFRTRFINCNLSHSVWEFCEMPNLIGCNLQYALMRGCFFDRQFTDCDWRYGRIIGADFDDMIFKQCDLREGRWLDGNCIAFENSDRGQGRGNFGLAFIDTSIDRLFAGMCSVRFGAKDSNPRVDTSFTNSKPTITDDCIPY